MPPFDLETPLAVAVTRYGPPARTLEISHRPPLRLTVEYLVPEVVPTTETDAPTTGLPDASVMVPPSDEEVVPCANVRVGSASMAAKVQSATMVKARFF